MEIKLNDLSRAIFFFLLPIYNVFHFNRRTTECCHSGLDQSCFFLLTPLLSKSPNNHSRKRLSPAEAVFSSAFGKIWCRTWNVTGAKVKPDKIYQQDNLWWIKKNKNPIWSKWKYVHGYVLAPNEFDREEIGQGGSNYFTSFESYLNASFCLYHIIGLNFCLLPCFKI